MLDQIKKQIIANLPKELALKTEDFVIPPDSKMGDLSLLCFNLAKKLGKNPSEIAKEIAARFQVKPGTIIEIVQAIGPYVNFTFKTDILAKLVLMEIKKQKNKIGESSFCAKQTILIEYPSNNTHKEVHVGHLRNICLGNALVELLKEVGCQVIPINYINDFGAHVARCLWGLQKFHGKERPPKNKQKWLGQIYAEASSYLRNHPEAKNEVDEYLEKLENREKAVWKMFLATRGWSLKGFRTIFKEMGVKHKITFYEKDVKETGQKMVDELLKKKIAQVGEGGAIIVNLEKDGLDTGLLRKSNGSGLYLTSDLGLAKIKAQKFSDITESINLTGTEQNFYFKQLFKILELAGFKYKMMHLSYELVTRPEGKMSSRLGNVILYEDLRDEALSLAEKETQKRHVDWSAVKIKKIARALALGAIKFSMVKIGPHQAITFDTKEALSFEGFTGPYLQYSLARINSIIRKNKNEKIKNQNFQILNNNYEKNLLLKLAGLDEAIKLSAEKNDPSQLAKYLYNLVKTFSDFYEHCPVLKAETADLQAARLELVKATKIVLEKGLNILGVPIIKEM